MDPQLTNEGAAEAGDRRSVVVVDDDPAVLAALRFLLEVEGFQVLTFGTGSELLAASALPKTGCLVIDFKLPQMDGLDLLAALRRRNVRLPAVLITSHPTAALRRRAAQETTPIVEKPLIGDALTDAIRSMMDCGANAH